MFEVIRVKDVENPSAPKPRTRTETLVGETVEATATKTHKKRAHTADIPHLDSLSSNVETWVRVSISEKPANPLGWAN